MDSSGATPVLPGMDCEIKQAWSDSYAVNDADYQGFNPAVAPSQCSWLAGSSCVPTDAGALPGVDFIRVPYWSDECVDIDSQAKYKTKNVLQRDS